MHKADKLKSIITELFGKCGVSQAASCVVADVLIAAELRGIPSHGLLRLHDYISMLRNGRIKPDAQPSVIHKGPSTVTLDGDNGLGPVVSRHAMQLAIEKAEKAGTGWVAVQNSNHFGIAGYYAMMALQHQMIGICMTNANPLVAPTFSRIGMMGTNPLAVAIPANEEPPVVADFATAAIARGKVDLLHKNNLTIEAGFLQDSQGLATTDPGILKEGGAILPLGSSRKFGSHKGYCMAAIIDIFSAVLSGANFGPFVPPSVPWLQAKDNLPGKGTGHFFGAMRIDAFRPAEAFLQSMDLWIRTFRNAPPALGEDRVLVPGDPEREAEKKFRTTGIPIQGKVKEQIKALCNDLNVPYTLD